MEQVIKDFYQGPQISGVKEGKFLQTQQVDLRKFGTNAIAQVSVPTLSTPQGTSKPNIEHALEKAIKGNLHLGIVHLCIDQHK